MDNLMDGWMNEWMDYSMKVFKIKKVVGTIDGQTDGWLGQMDGAD